MTPKRDLFIYYSSLVFPLCNILLLLRIKAFLILLVYLLFPYASVSQNYVFKKIPLFPDRNEIIIKDVTADSLGFIWFLHNSEVYRYDGYRSLNILPTINEFDYNDTPQKILADQNNRLWIAGMERLSYLDLKTWKIHHIDPDILPDHADRKVLWIKQMQDETIIVAYQNGWLVLFQNGQATPVSTLYNKSLNHNNSIQPQSCTYWKGKYYIGTSAGTLFTIEPNQNNKTGYLHFPGIDQLIYNMFGDGEQLIIDVFKQGLFSINESLELSPVTISDLKYNPDEERVFQEGSDFHVYANRKSITVLDKKLKAQQTIEAAIRSQHVLIKNREIIIGTDEGIFTLFKKTQGLSHLLPCNENRSNSVRGMFVFKDGGVFWGSYGGAGYVDVYGQCHSLENLKSAYCVLPLNEQELLVGTEGGFLKIFNRQNLSVREYQYTLSEEAKKRFSYNLPSVVLSMVQQGDAYYIGSPKGLWHLNKSNGVLQPIDIRIKDKIISNLEIRHILPDQSAEGWLLSTQLGLVKVSKEGKGEMIYPQEGSTLIYKTILSNDTLWLATQGRGLVAINERGELLNSWTKSEGLSDNTVFSMEMVNDLKAIGTADGLNLFQKGKMWHMKEKDGLKHPEFNSGATFWDAQRGRLYMGGLQGYSILETEMLQMSSLIEPSYVSELHIASSQSSLIKKDFTWPYANKNSIELRPGESISGLYLGSPGNYRSDIIINYTIKQGAIQELPPGQFISLLEPSAGTYPLMIKTISAGVNVGHNAIFIRKLPAFYETWWFITFILLLIIAMVTWWYGNKFQKIKREQDIRNRIAADLHDEVGGLLTGISMQVELLQMAGNYPVNNKNLSRLSILCKEVHHSMNDVVWSLNSRNDGWKNLLDKLTDFGHTLFEASAAHFSMKIVGAIPEKISQEERQAVYFFIKEALNNACKHAQAQTVQLEISFGAVVKILIKDDGNGFLTTGKFHGNGINNMKIRAHSIGGYFTINSSSGGTILTLEFRPKYT